MLKPCWLLSAASLLLFVLAAHSQDKATPAQDSGSGQGSGTVVTQIRTGQTGGIIGGLVGGSLGPGLNNVRGFPFSADVIDESDQFLTDGNHIHRETHGKLFRDSEGRTRTESEMTAGVINKSIVHIFITDPVEKTSIILNPQQKTAIVNHFGAATATGTNTRPVQRPTPAPSTNGNAQVMSLRAMSSHEDLGTMEMEGFTVHGNRNSFTMPAGMVGNDKPMTSVTESWYCKDLKTDLLVKSESPQSGKRVHRLLNIRTGDPDPLLFQVPADYTVEDKPQR